MTKVKITSPSFSKNKVLIEELRKVLSKKNYELFANDSQKRLEGNDLQIFLSDAEIAVIGLEVINMEILKKLPNLKMISKYGVGLDNINIKDCKDLGITLGWTPGVNKRSVSEMVLGFMLGLARNLSVTHLKLKEGIWHKDGGFQLTGKTIGILGLGNIGQDLVKLLAPLGCKIIFNDIEDRTAFSQEHCLKYVTLEEVFQKADFVTVHVPLTRLTQGLINYSLLSTMKKGSFFINTSRGGVLIQDDLKRILKEGLIAGAALDVYETEPLTDRELVSFTNIICTPHIGGNAKEAVLAMGKKCNKSH